MEDSGIVVWQDGKKEKGMVSTVEIVLHKKNTDKR